MSLVQRFIQVSFHLEEGYGNVGAGTLSYSNLRISANVTLAGSTMSRLHLSIYGMTLDEMNALSYIPYTIDTQSNSTIVVLAGDSENGMSEIFRGVIIQAWPNMQNAPQVSFDVEAMYGAYNGVMPAKPPYVSYTGPTDVASIFQRLASMHVPALTFENNGVNLKIDSPYFFGSPRNMLHSLGKVTRVGWVEEIGKLAIWPQGGSRQSAGGGTVIAPPQMVGYPVAVPGYIVVKKLFDRLIEYATQVTVKSDITRANGNWTVLYYNLELDSMMPHGRWFATLFCSVIGHNASPPPRQ